REQHVDPASAAQVQHHLTLLQLRQGSRIAAAQRRQERSLRERRGAHRIVEIPRDRVRRAAIPGGAAARSLILSLGHLERRQAVALAYDFPHSITHGVSYQESLIYRPKKKRRSPAALAFPGPTRAGAPGVLARLPLPEVG